MKKVFQYFLIIVAIASLSFFLVSCGKKQGGSTEKKYYTVTYVSTNYDTPNVVKIYEEGTRVKEITPPHSDLGWAIYSLSSNFNTDYIDPGDKISSIDQDYTFYLRWYGKKVGYIICYYDNLEVGIALAMYNSSIWRLPSENQGGIGVIDYEEMPKNDDTIIQTQPMSTYCKGYEFDGWYTNKECTKKATLPIKIDSSGNVNLYSKKGKPNNYTLTITYGGVTTIKKTVAYDTNLVEMLSVLPQFVEDAEYTFDTKTNLITYKPIQVNGQDISEKNNGWPAADNLEIYVPLRPKYEEYFLVKSTSNADLNNKMLPYEIFENYLIEAYWNSSFEGLSEKVRTVKPYGSNTSIAFKFSDIEEIKFKNSYYLPGSSLQKTYYLAFPNLKKIDLSEMKHLSEIPNGFFYGAGTIEEVYAPNLPNLTTIGAGFLCYNNIKKFTFDFSHVKTIYCGFLDNAFNSSCSKIIIDLSKLQKYETSADYLKCGFLAIDKPIEIEVDLGDFTSFYASSFVSTCNNERHFPRDYKVECAAYITIFSHDAVVLETRLTDYPNITVEQYSD